MTAELSAEKFAKAVSAIKDSPVVESVPLGAVTFGHVQETGVVIVDNGTIEASLRSPSFIPNGGGGFGGEQREAHLEGSLAAPPNFDKQHGLDITEEVLDNLSNQSSLKDVADKCGGVLTVGVESEMVVYGSDGQIDESIEDDELTRGQKEKAHSPVSDPEEFLKVKAEYVVTEMTDGIHNETSAPVAGKASGLKLNDQREDIGPYIHVVQTLILDWLDEDYDKDAWKIWNQVAQNEGYDNMRGLLQSNGTLAPWLINALHMSQGAAHFRVGNKNYVLQEHLIGAADLVSSGLGAPLGWVTASTPIMFGVEPEIDGQKIRDVRLEGRHLLPTSGPNVEPIQTHDTFISRTVSNIVEGRSHTIARAAYNSSNGRTHAVMHGQARIRHEGKYGQTADLKTGRVEATGMGATPNILDQASALGYLQVLGALNIEACSQQKPAITYASELGLTSATNFDIRSANAAFNRYNDSPVVSQTLEDALRLINYARKYPALRSSCDWAEQGIIRLTQEPANGLDDYARNPSGCFADVVRNEYNRVGEDPVRLAHNLHSFQQKQARKVLGL